MFCVLCFVHVRVLGLRCVIMSSKTKLRTKLVIRNDRLCYIFLQCIEYNCVCVLDLTSGLLCFGIPI